MSISCLFYDEIKYPCHKIEIHLRIEYRQKPKFRETHNFLGNINVADVLGFRTSKKDLDVGDKTAKLYEQNISLTSRKKKGIF